jgi:hypothetical protein
MGLTHGRQLLAAMVVAGTTARGPEISLGTSPTFTFGINGNTITGSAAGGGGGNTGFVSAGGATASLGTVVFSNSNGISFGIAGQTVTGSHNAVTSQTNQQITMFATGNTTQSSTGTTNASSIVFRGAGDASIGITGGSVVVSIPSGVLTSQSNQALSGQNGSFTFQTASFSNANGISFGTSAGPAMTASYTVPTVTNSSWSVSDAATSGTVARLAFTNLNGVTLSLSSGAGGSHTIVGSHNALTSQSNQAFSAAGGSSAFQTLGFSDNSAGSFTNTNGSVGIASVRASLFAASNTTQSSSGTQNLNALTFAGAGIASIGITNGSVIVSVPSGGGAGDGGVFAGVSNLGNTAGSTGTVSTGNFVLVGSNGISLSQSTGAAGSAATVTINGPLLGTQSTWAPFNIGQSSSVAALGNGSVIVAPAIIPPGNCIISRIDAFVSLSISTSSNSSHAGVVSVYFGIYTRNASTLSLATSGSQSHQWSNTSNNSVGSISGVRRMSAAFAATMTPGDYWIAFMSKTSSTNANWFTASNVIVSQGMSAPISGLLGEASNGTFQMLPGFGQFTATSAGMPSSMAFSHISGHGQASSTLRQIPVIVGVNYTA